jgi:hypothetical protein
MDRRGIILAKGSPVVETEESLVEAAAGDHRAMSRRCAGHRSACRGHDQEKVMRFDLCGRLTRAWKNIREGKTNHFFVTSGNCG